MDRILRLIVKAKKIARGMLSEIVIVEYKNNAWHTLGHTFQTLEEAQAFIDEIIPGDDGTVLIFNDAGVFADDTLQDKQCSGSPPDTVESNKHDGKRRDGHKNSKYNHSWV